MNKYTAEQNEQYYKIRLDPYKLHHSKGMQFRAQCPIHGGDNPNALLVNLDDGNFKCFTKGCKGGSIYTFEMLLLQAEGKMHNVDQVKEAIADILGTPLTERFYPEPVSKINKKKLNRHQAQASYVYTDQQGMETLTVYRFMDRNGGKGLPCDRKCGCTDPLTCDKQCDNGRICDGEGVPRYLYRVTDVMQSLLVFVVEGEKNADDLNRSLAAYIRREGGFEFGGVVLDRIAVTTNQSGALAWLPDLGYGKYFFGKTVIKLGDNDASGRIHDQMVQDDVSRYAKDYYKLDLPVGEGEDISDFLQGRTADDLFKLLPNLVKHDCRPSKPVIIDPKIIETKDFFVVPSKLVSADKRKRDWLVDGLIERGTKGLVVARPKTGKSLLFLEIAVCLASGKGLFGGRPYIRPVKVAVVSREDGPEIVQDRLYQLAKGHGLDPKELDRNILINTHEQASSFNIQKDDDRKKMIDWLRAGKVEFCVIDVLERIHLAKENSNDEMKIVMKSIEDIGKEAECQMCVIHHTREDGGVKGATSIEGWADYIFKLESDSQDETIKTLKMRTKSSAPIPEIRVRYTQSADLLESRIHLLMPMDEVRPTKDYKSRASDGYYQ